MNYSDPAFAYLAAVLAVPIAAMAALNWAFRNRGGFAKGWTGAVFIGICWVAALVFIFTRVAS